MSGPFYYLIASLPELTWGERPRWSVDQFLQVCRDKIPTGTYQMLESVELFQGAPAPTALPLLNRWYAREHALRNALARLRAERLEIEPARNRREVLPDEAAHRLAGQIMTLESPRTAEDALDRFRWEFLEGLEMFHYFDVEKLVVYLLKLRLLERRSAFDPGKGRARAAGFMDRARRQTEAVLSGWKGEEP